MRGNMGIDCSQLNNTMDNSNNNQQDTEKATDEKSGLLIETKIKIFDPESGEVIVEGRA